MGAGDWGLGFERLNKVLGIGYWVLAFAMPPNTQPLAPALKAH
jgi:hypothetical protein